MKYNFYPFCGGKNYELVLVNNNKAVIKMNTTYCRAPYNGYVTFPAKNIPKDWWGNYSAGALQYLNIHGGITFCECYTNHTDKNKEIIDKARKKIDGINEKDFMKKFKKQNKIRLRANQETAELNDSYIVFGFDCAHAHDENDNSLYNPKYVMKLVETMEEQLIEYAKIYETWKKMNRKDQLETIENIVGKIDTSNLGLGAMIDMLAGGKAFKED